MKICMCALCILLCALGKWCAMRHTVTPMDRSVLYVHFIDSLQTRQQKKNDFYLTKLRSIDGYEISITGERIFSLVFGMGRGCGCGWDVHIEIDRLHSV